MKSMKERIRLRNIEVARFPTVMRIRITTSNRTIFIGKDNDGKKLYGTLNDEFDIPKDLSRSAATKLLMSGFAVPADESAKAEKYIPEPAKPKKLKLRVEPPIEMIKITGGGARTQKTKFRLGDGIIGSVGDYFTVGTDCDMSEENARKLIAKNYAIEKEKPLARKVLDEIKKVL